MQSVRTYRKMGGNSDSRIVLCCVTCQYMVSHEVHVYMAAAWMLGIVRSQINLVGTYFTVLVRVERVENI